MATLNVSQIMGYNHNYMQQMYIHIIHHHHAMASEYQNSTMAITLIITRLIKN